MPSLKSDQPKFSSSAIWPIAGMKSLRKLDLSRCPKITKAGIKHLLSIPTLEELNISQTGVTSDGVSLLSSLKNLSMLDLGGLPVLDDALCSLQVTISFSRLFARNNSVIPPTNTKKRAKQSR